LLNPGEETLIMESLVIESTDYIVVSAVFLSAALLALALAFLLVLAKSSASELRLARSPRHPAARRRMR
jgi:hypothetical protein